MASQADRKLIASSHVDFQVRKQPTCLPALDASSGALSTVPRPRGRVFARSGPETGTTVFDFETIRALTWSEVTNLRPKEVDVAFLAKPTVALGFGAFFFCGFVCTHFDEIMTS